MKIEEVFSIYEFLGKLGIGAFIGISILILIVILTILLPLKEKIAMPVKVILLVEALALLSLIILYSEALKRNKLLPIANAVKANCIQTMFYNKSFRAIQELTYQEDDSTKLVATLKQLAEQYPSDFLLVHLWSKTPSQLDSFGLRINDPEARESIEKKIDDLAERTALLMEDIARDSLKNHLMKMAFTNRTDKGESIVLSTEQIKLINNQGWLIDQDFFRALAGRHGWEPIYGSSVDKFNNLNIIGFTISKTHFDK